MNQFKKLPDAEFEVMKAIWKSTPPVTTRHLMELIGNQKGWKTPALITLLNRLGERGFLRSEKNGKERHYFPLITEASYLEFETSNFVKRFHGNSVKHLVASMYDGKALTDQELDELLEWAKDQRKNL